MLFPDKLKTLMDITHTSNKVLAKHLIVDPSMISQLRTGARNISKKNDNLKNMADYFASRCNSESRIIELQNIIDDEDLNSDCTVAELSDILFRFLSEDVTTKTASKRVIDEIFKTNPHMRRTELPPVDMPDKTLLVCHNIDEKKKYMNLLFEYYMSLEKPDIIYFSSEEIVEWVYNDPEYYENFRSWCLSLIEKGFTIIRIMKPMENKEHFLKNIFLWLPIFLTGGVHLYYYPHFRDDMFRQTIITTNNGASYFSSSIAQTDTCYYSFVSTNTALSAAYVRQIKDYLSFCNPSFYVYTTKHDIAETYASILGLSGDRISKSFQLTSVSAPFSEMIEYMSLSDNENYKNVAKALSHFYMTKHRDENKNSIIDMCTIASTEDVINGKVRMNLPGFFKSYPLYYDTALYVMHLKHILYLLNTNPNYHFYPLEDSDFGDYGYDYYPVSVVDNQAMIVSSKDLLVQFTQPEIIRTMYENLFRQAMIRRKYFHSRGEIISLINERIISLTE
jgi:hypothetical protein